MKKLIVFIVSLLVVFSATAVTHNINIENSAFLKNNLEINVGDTVVWNNNDGITHTVTSDMNYFDSGNIAADGTFSFTFTGAGTFSYYCKIHPSMTGQIIVVQEANPRRTSGIQSFNGGGDDSVNTDDLPDLTSFHQFFGQVKNLPEGEFNLKVFIEGGKSLTVPVSLDGKFGYNEVLKINAEEGKEVNFVFISKTTGVQTSLGKKNYVRGGITDLTFTYGIVVTDDSDGSDSDSDDETTGSGTGSTQGRSPYGGQDNDENVIRTPPGPCLQGWDCGLWGGCVAGSQSRVCIKNEICEKGLAEGKVTTITTVPKPIERQSCQVPGAAGVECTSGKKCTGRNLQQCSSGKWVTISSCPNECDSEGLSCKSSSPGTTPAKKEFPWLYIGIGVLVLIGIIVAVLIVFKGRKKDKPLHDYITTAKKRGFKNSQIRSKLVAQGWDLKKVDKILGR